MSQTEDRQITPDLTFSQFEILKAIPRSHVFMKGSEPGTWRCHNGSAGYVCTTSMRSLITRGLVKPRLAYTDGRRGVDITQAGYTAMSKASNHKPAKRGRR